VIIGTGFLCTLLQQHCASWLRRTLVLQSLTQKAKGNVLRYGFSV